MNQFPQKPKIELDLGNNMLVTVNGVVDASSGVTLTTGAMAFSVTPQGSLNSVASGGLSYNSNTNNWTGIIPDPGSVGLVLDQWVTLAVSYIGVVSNTSYKATWGGTAQVQNRGFH